VVVPVPLRAVTLALSANKVAGVTINAFKNEIMGLKEGRNYFQLLGDILLRVLEVRRGAGKPQMDGQRGI
jgi:hypothetical protein